MTGRRTKRVATGAAMMLGGLAVGLGAFRIFVFAVQALTSMQDGRLDAALGFLIVTLIVCAFAVNLLGVGYAKIIEARHD